MDEVVQRHLIAVTERLRRETPAGDAPRWRRRRQLLDRLEAYALAGVFPVRPAAPRARRVLPPRRFVGDGKPRQPRFVDHRGVACAVGHLMRADRPDLVERIARTANDAYLPEIEDAEIAVWAEQNGFSPDDLAWIQPNYEFEIAACEDYDPGEVEPQVTEPVQGVDIAISPREMICFDDCEGPVRVWAEVANLGDTAADATIRVAADDGWGASPTSDDLTLASQQIALAPGEWKLVGPLVIDDEDEMSGFSLYVEAVAAGDVNPANQLVSVLGIEAPADYGPAGCADDDTGSDRRGSGGRGGGGCSQAPVAPAFLAPLLALAAARPRRQRR